MSNAINHLVSLSHSIMSYEQPFKPNNLDFGQTKQCPPVNCPPVICTPVICPHMESSCDIYKVLFWILFILCTLYIIMRIFQEVKKVSIDVLICINL